LDEVIRLDHAFYYHNRYTSSVDFNK
jgi:hypothetical protein